MSQTTHPMFAVLIGIDAYENATNLKGPSQDLKLMGALCDRLGVSVEQRKVLSGAGATVAKIQAAFDWLEAALEDEDATALVHFSGHGTLFNQPNLPESLALAAYDFAPNAQGTATEQGVVTLADLASRFGQIKAPAKGTQVGELTAKKEQEITSEFLAALEDTKLARITVVLDCCWNQADVSTSDAAKKQLLTYRMLVGCTRNDVANEIKMDGVYVGAFTWALTTALSRWQVVKLDGNRQMTVTHGKLMDRVNQLFSSLRVRGQNPMIAGPRVLDEIPVFQRSMDWDTGAVVSEEPDVMDDHRQLWGGDGTDTSLTYLLQWRESDSGQAWKTIASVTANNDTAVNTETWRLNKDEMWQWLNYTDSPPTPNNQNFAQIRIHRVPQGNPTNIGVFGWSWTRNTSPTSPPAALPDPLPSNDRLYSVPSGTNKAILLLSTAKTGTGNAKEYELKSLRWWSTTVKTDDTFDPTFGPTLLSSSANKAYKRALSPSLVDMESYPSQPIPGDITIKMINQ